MKSYIEIKKYLFWKLGINKFVQKITKNYWNKGRNYDWVHPYIDKKNLEKFAILEVGSRDALDSISMLELFNFKKAYIFEPSIPGIRESLKNIEKSKFEDRINFYPFALGEKIQLRTFYENIEKKDVPNIGASSFVQSNLSEYREYKVPLFRATDVLQDQNINFYLAMIDVESFEFEVLNNQKKFFSKFKMICVEVKISTERNPQNKNLIEIDKILKSYGFQFLTSKNNHFSISDVLSSNLEVVDLLYKKN